MYLCNDDYFLPALRVWTRGRRAPHGSSSVRRGSHRCDGGVDEAGVGAGVGGFGGCGGAGGILDWQLATSLNSG